MSRASCATPSYRISGVPRASCVRWRVGLADAAKPASLPRWRAILDGVDILVVDDNDDALDIMSTALGQDGARVRTATSGLEALAQIRRAPPHVVLCDLAMPGMDGFDVLKHIQDLDEGTRVTPVLAVTAYVSDDYRERCRRAGFHGHVPKPLQTSELIREVAAALART